MRGSRKFCQRGSNSDNVLFRIAPKVVLINAKWHQKWAIIGPPRKRHLNVSLVGRWWPNIEFWFGSFAIFQGIWPIIAKKPYTFLVFMGVQTLWISSWLSFISDLAVHLSVVIDLCLLLFHCFREWGCVLFLFCNATLISFLVLQTSRWGR